MIKFETINGTLCRMVEPKPLQLDSPMPCVVRYIQDCSPMGRYMKRKYAMVINTVAIVSRIGTDWRAYSSDKIFVEEVEVLEIIGYQVDEGSRWWALYQMMQGEKICHHKSPSIVYCKHAGDIRRQVRYNCVDYMSASAWLNGADKNGWQLYKEPKPEPAKEPEIVAHKQHATCLMCGKEIKGLLDRHATVSIKRYSISSLYESTYSHYCGKCFLELGFDATERKLRNRQQPIAEPKPPREQDYVICKRCGGTGYEIKPEPAPKLVVVPMTISGTVRQAYNEDGTIDDEQFQLLPNGIWDGTEMFISFDALDSHTRKLVESLLKAQIKENA